MMRAAGLGLGRALLTVAVVASACSSPSEQSDPDPAPAAGGAGGLDDPGPERVDCPSAARSPAMECYLMEVPVDPADRDGARTDISFSVVAGSDHDSFPLPLAVLQGGPGGASTELAVSLPPRPFTQVFIDQRGTGFGRADFGCPEVREVFADVLEASSGDARRLELDAYRRCAQRIQAMPEFAHTHTVAHAADVAEVMAALDYESWLVYGVSYGTTIGLELLRRAPRGLAGAVLDGVYPPDLDVDAELETAADRVIAELGGACSADDECAAAQPDLADALTALIRELDDSPAEVALAAEDTSLNEEVNVLVDGETLAAVIYQILYSDFTASLVPTLVSGIDQGDPLMMEVAVALGLEYMLASATENAHGTYFAVTCADRSPFSSGPPQNPSAFAGKIVGEGVAAACEAWNVAASPPSVAEPVRSDLPVLLVSGRFDPITPPEHAETAARSLPNAVHVERDGRSHGVWFVDDCVAGIVEDFVADPGAPTDTACALGAQPLDWSWPS